MTRLKIRQCTLDPRIKQFNAPEYSVINIIGRLTRILFGCKPRDLCTGMMFACLIIFRVTRPCRVLLIHTARPRLRITCYATRARSFARKDVRVWCLRCTRIGPLYKVIIYEKNKKKKKIIVFSR